ncbi:MAG: GapA-binding peptide SR1P [Bacillaceae bacterium]|nr:GapA-binding peptide SR1P [Bacillaceae bacterium]
MGTIVCQHCGRTIDHFDSDKVVVLYAACRLCGCKCRNRKK